MPPRADDDLTLGATTTAVGARTPASGPAPSGGFAPGAVIAGRYRLVALLGRGGMGEVYRADDLLLDHPVALKFLPEGAAATPERLAQFHNELRIARQVSHRNVCRLYDLGDADGRRFLTMEYVDGEDLASLLRRIGRLPPDKAVEIARQLCAGLAAAHERGVLHRDLKPANVMIDGDGNVRITDFGLAVATHDTEAAHAGTPQYMAPEQLRGERASIRSDIYALGLVLFEMFTGRRAYEAKTLQELIAFHDSRSAISTPTAIVRDLDPAIERAILRCLERDPDRRPPSALTVAASLPGADPLAAALAAGETPSPDLIVAAGESEAMPIGRGLLLILALVAALLVYAALSPRVTLAGMAPLDHPPAVLIDRAQHMLGAFGAGETPVDSAYNFSLASDFPRWLVETDQTTARWSPAKVGNGPAVLFWYRTSAADMMPIRPGYTITMTDPPLRTPGMALVVLDSRGRLQRFERVPSQHDTTPAAAAPVGWAPLFDAAGLAMNAFAPVAPEWTPPEYGDTRVAWEGPDPNLAGVRLRVEAASDRGRPVWFAVIGPWTRPVVPGGAPRSTIDAVLGTFSIVLWLTVLFGSMLLARHNLAANRADRRGAARLAIAFLIVHVSTFLLAAHHVPEAGAETNLLFNSLTTGAFSAGVLWVLYLGLEPYVRRFWPDGLLGWTRLLSGHIRDPRVGREILVGAALGGALMILDVSRSLAPRLIGRPTGVPALGFDVASLAGVGLFAAQCVQQLFNSIQTALLVATVFVALRLFVRRTWLAVTIGLVVVAAAASANMPPGGERWMDLTFAVAAIGLITVAVFRFGLLVTVVTLAVDNIPTAVPFSTHVSAWSATPGNLAMALVVALACFGFYAARAGQPLFGRLEV